MSINEKQIRQFMEAIEAMLVKMQEIDNTCIEVTNDLSKREFGLIVLLGKHKSLIMKEVADFMGVPMSTATGIVDKLVSKNYLMRFYSEEDRRIVRIGLSKNGEGLYCMLEKMMHYFGKHILEGFSSEEREQFIFLLNKATHNLDFKMKAGEFS